MVCREYDMREFIVSGWEGVMNMNRNPLRHIPDMQVRHLILQILAWMWSAVFGLYIIESIYAFGISALAHALFLAMTCLTAIYFKQLKTQKIDGILTRGQGGEHE